MLPNTGDHLRSYKITRHGLIKGGPAKERNTKVPEAEGGNDRRRRKQ